jgi:lipid II:glycine glycyltransferase (peptidoglycan interpeptide bridge formation enzyme)
LARKHGATPVHSLAEMMELVCLFPDSIKLFVAKLNDEVLAGTLLFISREVVHAQYIASNLMGYSLSALDMVFNEAIEFSKNLNMNYFDFGISNENQGLCLNEGLYEFKSEFGGGGVVHEFYELQIRGGGEGVFR